MRAAVTTSGIAPPALPDRFAVGIAFRTPAPLNANEVWDQDNLIKPTLDALEGVFGPGRGRGCARRLMTESIT